MEELARAHNTRLESLEETEHSHEEDAEVSEGGRESDILPTEAAEIPLNIGEEASEVVPDDPSSNDEASQPEPGSPEPTEESEDTDARFRPEPKVDDPPVVKVDISTNLSGPAKQMLEKTVAEKLAELESKSGIKAQIEIN